jgi:uncharacterized membrane protein YeaQ/YmgE (transglycosylase-associated protein family)
MGILSWIAVGLIAGWLAEQVVRRPHYGIIGATILGVAGALLGGFLASAILKIPDPVSGINLTTIFTAFLGSIGLLMLIRTLNFRRF